VGERGSRVGWIALALAALAVAALAGSWAWMHLGWRLGAMLPAPEPRTIRVQVLNGSGERSVASKLASYLREGGFPVVDVRNADRSDYFASIVVARRADVAAAAEVARYLGGLPVIRQAWGSNLADVTVVLGRDRSRLHLEQ
jgi:hypothetical protein